MSRLKRSNFSTPQLTIFVVAFALIGYLIFRSFALNPNLPGDLNNDNTVNITDLSILLSNYGTSNTTADINTDGTVNVLDLSILLSHYGQSYTPATNPTIGPASLPDGTTGVSYSQALTTSGGSNGPYSLRVTQGALPAGITFNGTNLSGTPTAVGSYAFTISAFDAAGTYSAFKDYTLSVTGGTTGSGTGSCITGSEYFCETLDSGTWSSIFYTGLPGNTIDVQNDPSGQPGKMARLYTPVGGGGPNANSSSAYLATNTPGINGTQGKEVWYRADTYLPSDYRPSLGNWNWFTEWHVSDGVPQNNPAYPGGGGVSNGLGVTTDYGPNYGNPRFFVRVAGGDYTNRTEVSSDSSGATVPIVRGHKYQMLYHIKWSQKNDGSALFEWYVDGALKWTYKGPNLFLTTTGAYDNVGYAVYNYHIVPAGSLNGTGDWDITTYFDNISAGPTRASIGG